jgi:hypothetical protein
MPVVRPFHDAAVGVVGGQEDVEDRARREALEHFTRHNEPRVKSRGMRP